MIYGKIQNVKTYVFPVFVYFNTCKSVSCEIKLLRAVMSCPCTYSAGYLPIEIPYPVRDTVSPSVLGATESQ